MTDLTEYMRCTMKQTLNNLRAILAKHKENMPVIVVAEILAEIDEAESNACCKEFEDNYTAKEVE